MLTFDIKGKRIKSSFFCGKTNYTQCAHLRKKGHPLRFVSNAKRPFHSRMRVFSLCLPVTAFQLIVFPRSLLYGLCGSAKAPLSHPSGSRQPVVLHPGAPSRSCGTRETICCHPPCPISMKNSPMVIPEGIPTRCGSGGGRNKIY